MHSMAIDLLSIRTRVKESGMFTQVRDVLSLADAVNNPGANLKTAFVVLSQESAEANRTMGVHRQRVSARISVAFPLQAQTIAMDRSDEVEAMRSTLKNHLAGFVPTGAETGLDYASSRIQSIARGFVWVELLFDCRYLFTPA
jgi:hypothetical protein